MFEIAEGRCHVPQERKYNSILVSNTVGFKGAVHQLLPLMGTNSNNPEDDIITPRQEVSDNTNLTMFRKPPAASK